LPLLLPYTYLSVAPDSTPVLLPAYLTVYAPQALGPGIPLLIKVGAFPEQQQLEEVLAAAAAAGARGVAGINGLSR
jgi:hypothetical protein